MEKLIDFISPANWTSYFHLILLFILGLVFGLTLYVLFFSILHYLKRRLSQTFISSVEHLFKIPLALFFPIVCISLVLSSSQYITEANALIKFMLKPLLIIAFAIFLIRGIGLLEGWTNKRFFNEKDYGVKGKTVKTQLQFVRRIAIIVVLIFTIALIFMNYESMREVATGILASATILSGIIIFAAQSSIGNVIAGFQIAFTQPIRIDDVVVAENEFGQVEEINLTYVVIRIWDGRRLVLPLNYFVQKPFQNWSRTTQELIGTIMLYTDYHVDIEAMRQELTTILQNAPLWDKRVNALQVTEAKENTLEIRVLVSAQNAGDLWNLRCYVREKLLIYVATQFPERLPKVRIETQLGQQLAIPPPAAQ